MTEFYIVRQTIAIMLFVCTKLFCSPGRTCGSFDNEIVMMNHVYKERFPKVIELWHLNCFSSWTWVPRHVITCCLLCLKCGCGKIEGLVGLNKTNDSCHLRSLTAFYHSSRPRLRWRGVCWQWLQTIPQTALLPLLTECWASFNTSWSSLSETVWRSPERGLSHPAILWSFRKN